MSKKSDQLALNGLSSGTLSAALGLRKVPQSDYERGMSPAGLQAGLANGSGPVAAPTPAPVDSPSSPSSGNTTAK